MTRTPARPVVLVHGILGQRHLYWNLFRRRLAGDGFEVREAVLPYSMLGDVRAAALALEEHVAAVCEETGAAKVDLVCHSAGGLVARYYVKFLDASRVGHLVLLGTPHRGTYFSYVMPLLRVAHQASPGSRLLAELNDGDDPDVRITNFWSPLDGIVVPAQNSVHPGRHVRNVRLPWTHHWGFLVSKRVYEEVAAALRSSPAQHDGPGGRPRRVKPQK